MLAALLACEPSAAVSHRTAAEQLGLLAAREGPVHITVAGHNPGWIPGTVIHRVDHLDARDVRRSGAMVLTTPARTLLDVAADDPAELDRAYDEALTRGLVRKRELAALLERSKGRRGAARLRSRLDRPSEPFRTRSDAERRFLELVRAAELPMPETNVIVGGFELDAWWPEQRVAVEIDSFEHHGSRRNFESDRARSAELQAGGAAVLQFTWRQLAYEPLAVVARLASTLAGR